MENYSSSEDDFIFMLLVGLFLAELAIGSIQLIGALIRTLILVNKNKPLGKLKTYWIIVLIYVGIFGVLYVAQYYICSGIWYRDFDDYNSEDYLLKIKLYSYFMSAYIFWIALAWLIAIWYGIFIVFNKKSYNMATTQQSLNNHK